MAGIDGNRMFAAYALGQLNDVTAVTIVRSAAGNEEADPHRAPFGAREP